MGGGIAAYKACELVRRLRESGHAVTVMPTDSALRFVGSATWEALSGRPVHTSVFDAVPEVNHVAAGQSADLVVIAPATASVLARAAHGDASDLLSATLLTTRAPVVFAPAMHTEMWEHPATQDNVATLRQRGNVVLTPDSGRLTGADSGLGRLPHPEAIGEVCLAMLVGQDRGLDLRGVSVLVSAGGTREALDPVRFIGNRSSGRQGLALAAAAVSRGARVEVVLSNVDLPSPAGCDVRFASSAEELRREMLASANRADIVVMAAAVADYRPASIFESKIKKESEAGLAIDLIQTSDILSEICDQRDSRHPIVVGFAAETARSDDELVELAAQKLRRKGADLIVANPVGWSQGFEQQENSGVIVGERGVISATGVASKSHVAHAILDAAKQQLGQVAGG